MEGLLVLFIFSIVFGLGGSVAYHNADRDFNGDQIYLEADRATATCLANDGLKRISMDTTKTTIECNNGMEITLDRLEKSE